jgi:aminodeoxyfutalosine synthase
MTVMDTTLARLEATVAAGSPLSRHDAEQLLEVPDLIAVGMLGETARRAIRGSRVSFCRVCVVSGAEAVVRGAAGEVRLEGVPASIAEARARVTGARSIANGVPLTGFSLADLVTLVGYDHMALVELARELAADGLDAVAEAPIDQLGDTEQTIEILRAVHRGGLHVWRATVHSAAAAERLEIIERAGQVQDATSAFKAFAPLPRQDPRATPSTGYDDVRTVAVARLMCRNIPSIQVDWPL